MISKNYGFLMTKRKESRKEMTKRITLRNSIFAFLGYLLPFSFSYIAIYMNLTSCSYEKMNFLLLIICLTALLFLSYIYFKKEITYRESQNIGIAQLVNWLFIFTIWLFSLKEARFLALPSAIIPFIFFFPIGSVVSSLVITIVFHIIFIIEAYYSTYFLRVTDTFKQDVFYCSSFFFSSLFIILMTQIYKKQRRVTKFAIIDSEKSKKKLEASNADLTQTYVKIRKTVDEISILSEMVAKDSAGITESSKKLSVGANDQAREINEIAKTMEQINLKTSENANSAVKANELTLLTKDSSSNGVMHMKDVNSAMTDIDSSSHAISKIISTIDSISFQTNHLALNASVEAARAGKHGRGFAVVAQEVRNLALKAAKAANSTADLIQISLNNVKTGTRTSKIAANALDEINEKIMDVTLLVESISESSNEQTSSISQVNNAMSKISKITKETAESAKDTNAVSVRLADTAVKIHKILKEFDKEKDLTILNSKKEPELKNP